MYEDDSDEKRSANMNMGPRTWYQVPRDLRYPEVSYSKLLPVIQSCHGHQLNNPSPFKCNLLWVIILMLKDQIYILYEFR